MLTSSASKVPIKDLSTQDKVMLLAWEAPVSEPLQLQEQDLLR